MIIYLMKKKTSKNQKIYIFMIVFLLAAVYQRTRREYEEPPSLSFHYLLSVLLITASSPGSAEVTRTLTAGLLCWITVCYCSPLSLYPGRALLTLIGWNGIAIGTAFRIIYTILLIYWAYNVFGKLLKPLKFYISCCSFMLK